MTALGESRGRFAALAWILGLGVVNRVARRARRVRQPRYALALLAGFAYFWFVLVRPRGDVVLVGAEPDGTAHLVYALGFAVLVASWWLFGSDEVALNFSPAEVQLLFTAPLTRREVVAFKLLQAQLVILVSVFIWMAILGRAPGPPAERFISIWIVFTALYLHRVGASLVRESAAEHGVSGVRKHLVAIVVVAAALGVLAWGIVSQIPVLRAGIASGNTLGAATAVLHAPTSKAVLYPFRLVLAPVFTSTTDAWLRAVWPALLLVIAHVVWVLRTDAAFEEAAAASAARRAVAIARRAGRAASPGARGVRRRFRLPLPERGSPAVAIAWKNVTALGRTMAVRTIVAICIAVVVATYFFDSVLPPTEHTSELFGRIALAFAAMLVVAGPLWVRNDLRLDMLQVELLRSFPVRGATLVRAELASALVTLSAVQVPVLVAAYALIPPRNPVANTWSGQTALLFTCLVVMPVVSALGLLVQNAGALLFPGWVRLGLARPGGIEAVGQGILTMFGSLVVLTLCLVIPGTVGAVVAVIGVSRVGLWGMVPGAIVGAALVAAELWWITAWLGRVFERSDEVPDETAAAGAA